MHIRVRNSLVPGMLGMMVLASALAGAAQNEKRASPHDKTEATVDGARISIEYGRPYVKGRKIDGGLVPYGKVWRTGADEATTMTTDKALMFGAVSLPAGTYTLFTLPGETEWKLVINKQTG